MNIAKFFRAVIAGAVLLAGVNTGAQAAISVFDGELTESSTRFNRPIEDLSDLSLIGTHSAYDALTFTVTAAGKYSFLATTPDFDGFVVLYKGLFNPAAPLTNAIRANDDLLDVNTSGFLNVLSANQLYTLVVAGYGTHDIGEYSVTIGGVGNVSAVPEPATWAMLGLGLVAVGYARRRKA